MGFKALITLDLPGVSNEKRENYYKALKDRNWEKIKNLTTAWHVSFNDEFTRKTAILELKNDLQEAKKETNVDKVEYALQLDTNPIVVNTLE